MKRIRNLVDCKPVGNKPYDANYITINNWHGDYYRVIRGSKKYIWASQMFMEGFVFFNNKEKMFGKRMHWFIIDGNEKYIMSCKMFKKTFYLEII